MSLFRGAAEATLYCAHRTSAIDLIDLSTLACFPPRGRAPMLVYVRPSNACPHLSILSEGAGIVSTARIEGPPLYRGASASTETSQLPRLPPSQGARSGSTRPTWVPFPSFSSCGLREHRKPSNLPSHAPSTFTPPLTGGWPAWAPTARVQRAPSERARCASTGGQQTTLPFFFTLDRGTPVLAMILPT
jgi:hypothetical protein